MIADWLTIDLQDLFTKNPHARVVLWFDKENEFGRLLDAGALAAKKVAYPGAAW